MPKDSLKSISESIKELTLKPKDKKFVKEFLDTNNGTEAVKKTRKVKNDNVAGVTAHRLLRSAKIQQAIEKASGGAFSRIEELSISAKNEAVRLSANKDIVDRGIGKAIESIRLSDPDGKPLQPTVVFIPKSYESNE